MRSLRSEESELLQALLNMVPDTERPAVPDCMVAIDLSDGGMGSVRLTDGSDRVRRLGRELVKAKYTDEDGVRVSISVNLDEEGDLFEIDIWKVDFSPLLRFPSADRVAHDTD
jgi:hypothetical protein